MTSPRLLRPRSYASTPLPRYQRGSLSRNARRRPGGGKLNEVRQAAYGYLALTLDTLLNYNNRSGRWDNTTSRVRSIFDRHDFAFVWSYAEMAPLISDVGYDWAIDKTAKCIHELVALIHPEADSKIGNLFDDADAAEYTPPPVTITCKPGDSLDISRTAASTWSSWTRPITPTSCMPSCRTSVLLQGSVVEGGGLPTKGRLRSSVQLHQRASVRYVACLIHV